MRKIGMLLVVFAFGACSSSTTAPTDGAADSAAHSASDVGLACTNPAGTPPANAIVSSPDPTCSSRICLVEPTRATCTASCVSDSDCQTADTTLCAAGFGCAVVSAGGPFACKKLCVCRDDIEPAPSCP